MIPMAMLGLKDSPLQQLMPEMNWMHPSSCLLSHHIYFSPHRLTSGQCVQQLGAIRFSESKSIVAATTRRV
ncbi:hypothetical protein I7I50_11528 [Histoplasma capsulatum G186AR]|uniref:Uncharacterized protein n=1 Tax=Ajellomyces capsulatus TaxID=5037 RepID=A0A8H7Z918_AJECA|nr:hypothetical protein I7I52_02765 [Histoplasma capsulatum]QSS70031.1 hypothetical protein I7I50_11528 [Histoplasma capsulatum G186AR]